MFTDSERELFSKILDTNWEASLAEKDNDFTKSFRLYDEVNTLKEELRVSMGDEAYNRFMDNGKEMFKPK